MSDINGMNNSGIDLVILDIYDYVEKITDVLNKYDDTMNKAIACFDCECGKRINSKYDNMKTNFPTVKENLLGYAEDLKKAKLNYENFVVELSNRIRKSADNFKV